MTKTRSFQWAQAVTGAFVLAAVAVILAAGFVLIRQMNAAAAYLTTDTLTVDHAECLEDTRAAAPNFSEERNEWACS